jgi:hypothetical protein
VPCPKHFPPALSYRQDNGGFFIAWRHPSDFAGRIEAVDATHASSMVATWLLSMTRDRSAQLGSREDIKVKWTGEIAYRFAMGTKLQEVQLRVQSQFAAMTRQLRDAGAMTQLEWENARLAFRLQVDDGRRDRLTDLPVISAPTELRVGAPGH